MRLIDADALEPDAEYDDGEFWAVSISQIENAPTIKPERKKGKWVTHKEPHKNMCYYIKCSKCGKEAIWTNGFSLYPPNFCPNCGADMRGEADG